MQTNYSTFRLLIAKNDTKPRLIKWLLFLQKLYFLVKYRKGTENQVFAHLSILEAEALVKLDEKDEINESSPMNMYCVRIMILFLIL